LQPHSCDELFDLVVGEAQQPAAAQPPDERDELIIGLGGDLRAGADQPGGRRRVAAAAVAVPPVSRCASAAGRSSREVGRVTVRANPGTTATASRTLEQRTWHRLTTPQTPRGAYVLRQAEVPDLGHGGAHLRPRAVVQEEVVALGVDEPGLGSDGDGGGQRLLQDPFEPGA
jgi:hypothetical protein